MRITTQRIRELRENEMNLIRRPFLDSNIKRISEEMAEALGELLEYRDAEEQGERMLETAPSPFAVQLSHTQIRREDLDEGNVLWGEK